MHEFPRQKPASVPRSYFWELDCSACIMWPPGQAIQAHVQRDFLNPVWKFNMETQTQVSSLSTASLTNKRRNRFNCWSHPQRKPICICTAQKLILFGYVWGGGRKKERKPNWIKSSSAQITSFMEIVPDPCCQLSSVTHRLWGNR